MKQSDLLGNPVTGATDEALEKYAQALHQFNCYRGDPVATIAAATAEAPDFAMGHLLHAWLHLLGTEPDAVTVAQADLDRVQRLPLSHRERGHHEAAKAFAAGEWHRAGRILEDVSIDYPRDALALQAGHVGDYMRGDPRMIRDRIARALGRWSRADPGYHAVLGMFAFGCEENGDYRRAENYGRRALDLEPKDAWAHHAVAHVFEMEGRSRDGIAWMRDREAQWAEDNFLAVHNWWHWALFHLDLNEIDAVLALFDGPIHGPRSRMTVDLIDASALLWRLQLRGIDVRRRWQSLADIWREVARPGLYAFNDFHAMMAWVASGDQARATQWIAAQSAQDPGRTGDHAAIARSVGRPLLEALAAFDRGDDEAAATRLRDVRPIAHRLGGSHAQRDLIDLTLIEAARRSGHLPLTRALVAERVQVKPGSAYNQALDLRTAA
ncbi:tetratricopeptide repeat protein [Thioalkalicoccus limnaeus]|uniref:Tetratricopeptide repeat protein 38 n=1 Tax=Thioalkalicoccus limnaeus TaxID=120681 RepID=A0ABV4BIN9_9GAMM